MTAYGLRAIMAAGGSGALLFAVLYSWRPSAGEDDIREIRERFIAWNPPTGLEVNAHYHYARGGGLAVVETTNASILFEALAPFTKALDFDIEPIVNVLDAVAISLDVEEWVGSVNHGKPGQEKRRG